MSELVQAIALVCALHGAGHGADSQFIDTNSATTFAAKTVLRMQLDCQVTMMKCLPDGALTPKKVGECIAVARDALK